MNRAPLLLADGLLRDGFLDRDGEGGAVENGLIGPVYSDRVDRARAERKVISIWGRRLNLHTSVSLLLDGFSFHLPKKGSFAARSAPVIRQADNSNGKARFDIRMRQS